MFFCHFLCNILIIEYSECDALEKTARFCFFAENSRFLFVYFLCVGFPILKNVFSHAHKWVTSDVIL